MQLLRRIAAFVGVGLVCALQACTTVQNPATGKKIYTMVTPEEEIQLGTQAAPGLTQEFGGKVENAQLQQYVSNIGKKLAAETEKEYPGLPWEFTLLNSPVINAFSLPGGKVFITRGLAEKMTNEAQMAGVLGHEIGHVTAQHVAQQMTQQQMWALGLGAVGVAVGAAGSNSNAAKYAALGLPALQIGSQLYMLKFSRTDESEADYLGMRYMMKAGYDPSAQMQVMQILQREAGAGGVEMLQTHPLPETRIKDIQKLLQSDEFRPAVNNPNYGLYPDRFQQQFLSISKKLPPPPAPKPQPQQGQQQQLQGSQNQRISRPRQ